MLTRFLRLRAANRVLAFQLPSVLKVFNNEVGENPSRMGTGEVRPIVELNRSVFV
jgi:hypothetical protein